MAKREEQNQRWRLSLIFSVSLFVTLVLMARLIQVQIVDRKEYVVIGDNQSKCKIQLLAKRGKILDRWHRSLAVNTPGIAVGAHPKLIENKVGTALQLSQLLDRDSSLLRSMLYKDTPFVRLARGLPCQMENKIKSLGIGGLQVRNDVARCYPHSRLAAHLIGFTDVDGNGISGVEYTYNDILKGTPGEAVLQVTANGTSFESVEYPVLDPQNGYNVVLTIDQAYQAIAEEELRETVEKSGALGGSVIVTNPVTGEILCMATEPCFEPSNAGKFHPTTWRLRPITDQMEPGSTFKVVIMSAIIEEGINKPSDIVFCEQGQYDIFGETIHDTKKYGWLTLHDVIVYSSNIGMAKTTLEVPPEIIYRYARAFGFGMKSGIGLDGESSGVLKLPPEWSGYTRAALAMGHEIAATPLQMAFMFGTIANGGLLLKPKIVKEILDNSGDVISRPESQIIRRVITQSTVETITTMMENVVKNGTGKLAAIDGFRICGKTGTARKTKKASPGYIKDKVMASFGGFFPADGKNKRCIFVVIDNPTHQYYGGDVAAPCFKNIAQRIIDLEGANKFLPDKVICDDDSVMIPSLIGRELGIVRQILGKLELGMRTFGEGHIVAVQNPKPGNYVQKHSKIVIELTQITEVNEVERVVPKVVGLHLREALNELAANGIEAIVNGSGKVISQQPKNGTRIRNGEQCLLECESSIDLVKLLNL